MSCSFMSVEHLVSRALLYLEYNGYSYSSIKRYHKCWKKLLEVCQHKNIPCFCYEQCLPLMLTEWNIHQSNPISNSQRFQLRTLICLRDFQYLQKFPKCYRKTTLAAPILNPEIFSEYNEQLKTNDLKASTIRNETYAISHFLQYQLEQGIPCISTLSPQLIIQYLGHLEKTPLSDSSKNLYLRTIKKYLQFLYLQQRISTPLHRLLAGNVFSKYVVLPSQYTQEELKAILSAIDRDSRLGRRDYLVMLLTMQLGIRAGDLCRLKLEHIYWETDSIRFTQQKTGKEQTLPLTEHIKYDLQNS